MRGGGDHATKFSTDKHGEDLAQASRTGFNGVGTEAAAGCRRTAAAALLALLDACKVNAGYAGIGTVCTAHVCFTVHNKIMVLLERPMVRWAR